MKRQLFYTLLFPPAFMNLMLVQAQPENLVRFFIAGYVVATIPAILIALTDEFLERRSLGFRAGWCMLVGYVSTPLLLTAPSLKFFQIGSCGAVVALICFAAFNKAKKKMLMLPSPEHFKERTMHLG